MGKVSAGDPLRISASDWNAMLDVVADRRSRVDGSISHSGVPAASVLVKNDSNQDVTRGQILGVGGPVVSPADNEAAFYHVLAVKGVTPTAPTHIGKFVVALESIAAGKMGRGILSGIAAVKLAVNYADHRYADIYHNTYNLSSFWIGSAEILWKQANSGTTNALVRLGIFETVRLRATAASTVAAGSSGTFNVYGTSPQQTLTAWLDWAEGGQQVSAGKEVFLEYFRADNKWRVTGAECE